MSVESKARARRVTAEWVECVISHGILDAPRCPSYPQCGGEDGTGACEHGDGYWELDQLPTFGVGRVKWTEHRAKIIAEAPRCKACAEYVAALDRIRTYLARK